MASSDRGASWPTAAQYNEAVQNLRTSMSDEELKHGVAAVNAMHLPLVYTGAFAYVYKVYCPTSDARRAVRFFRYPINDQQLRYAEIGRLLSSARLPFMVNCTYLDKGVLIEGNWYPLVKMDWIEGQMLNQFVADVVDEPQRLQQLYASWLKLAAGLRASEIAHADLEHGNVLLVPDSERRGLLLRLVDYDGMFVPALASLGSREVGHPNYQYPQRKENQTYSIEVDRFSHLAICCAVRCLCEGGRQLWERYNSGENLLFTEKDFEEPAHSRLFHELWALSDPDARALVGHLALATQRPLEESPLVEQLMLDGHVQPLDSAQNRAMHALLHGASPAAADVAPPARSIAAATTWTNSLGMQFRLIPAGEFDMGSTDGESWEQPVHHVRITHGFYLGIHQVTQAAYRAVTGKDPSYFKGSDLPVEQVSWDDAVEYCGLLTERERKSGVLSAGAEYRLPTEAEWEYACRAGSTARYSCGDSESHLMECAWYDADSGAGTQPVGQKKPNAWGLYDMHGNVWEWCQDWWGAFGRGVVTDPHGPSSGSLRVYRGGSWYSGAWDCRATHRSADEPSYRYSIGLGFRLARSVP